MLVGAQSAAPTHFSKRTHAPVFPMTAILRTWTFWILTPLHEECQAHLERTKLPELQSFEGCQRSSALFRDLGDGSTEVTVVSSWVSMAAIRAAFGDEITRPSIDPEDRKKLIDREQIVRHYPATDRHAISLAPAEMGPSQIKARTAPD